MVDEYWFIKWITQIPRFIIRLFHLKHRCNYVYDGSFDGGLAGEVNVYKCIWCGDSDIRN